MIEPIYSSHGGAEKGYRCKVLCGEPLRECGKLCKSYWGAQRHGWLIHGLKIQMELIYDAEKIQEQANEQFSAAVRSAAEGDSNRTITGELFESDSERDRR